MSTKCQYKPCIFELHKIPLMDNALCREKQHPKDYAYPDKDMNAVNACHDVIEAEKNDLAPGHLLQGR